MDQNLKMIWENCLLFMRDNLSSLEESSDLKKLEGSFDLLFDKVQPLSLVEGNLTLLVPSDFYKEYIEDNYLSLLSVALKKYIGKGVKLWYSVSELKEKGKDKTEVTYKGRGEQCPKVQEVRPASFAGSVVNPFVVPGIKKVNIDSNLNPALSFENFIEGESNKFAFTVAKTISSRPGQTSFNPLFIHGGVGVGKTHLAHAIGLEVKNLFPEKVVLYLSSEKFIQQFVAAAKSQNKTDFGNFYQMVDVLIIDDIQFLSGKSATQDMFFHIFDHLHQNGKQIVIQKVREAEKYAEEDKKRKEETEARNKAEALVYDTEKSLKELDGKLSDSEKSEVEAAKEDLKKAIEDGNIDEIKDKTDKLTEKFHIISTKLYEQAQADAAAAGPDMGAQAGNAGAAGAGAQDTGSQSGGDNVVDADYEVVDDDK